MQIILLSIRKAVSPSGLVSLDLKNMKVGVLFSGGKDSCLALHKFIESGGKIDCLMAMIPKTMDSFMFHTPDLKLLTRQAEMLGLPLILQETDGIENEEISDLRNLIKKSEADAIVIGGIESSYQGDRIKKLAGELGIKVIAPLLKYSAEKLWGELFSAGFKVIVTKIASEGIPKEILGKVISVSELENLKKLAKKYKFRMDFEGGDAETSVLFMPEFLREIKIDYEIYSEGRYRHFLRLKSVK